jgi:hypothetical protein
MKVLTIYRYSREKDHKPKFVDDLPNFFYFTHTKNRARPLLEKGISPIGVTNASDGDRHPAILISFKIDHNQILFFLKQYLYFRRNL